MKHGHLYAIIFGCFVGVLAPAAVVFAADTFRVGDPLPQVVVDAWQKRREGCRSVHWKLNGRELITKGMLNYGEEDDVREFGPRPQQDEWRERNFETWIDFTTLRVRNESRGTLHHFDGVASRLLPNHTAHLFDGTSLQNVEVHNKNRVLELDPAGVSQGLVFDPIQMPLFWGVGIVFGPDTPYTANKLNNRLDPQKFRITAVQRDGDATHVTVRANLDSAKTGYFVDHKIVVEWEGAIVAYSLTSNGRLAWEMNVDWSQTQLGWQPVSWKKNSFHGDKTLAISGECEVVERSCTPDLSAVAFHFDPRTGTPYLDVKKRTTFVKSPPGQPDVPKALYDIQHAARQRRWKWLISGAIVLACIGGGVWWWRRRTGSSAWK